MPTTDRLPFPAEPGERPADDDIPWRAGLLITNPERLPVTR
jgi:hypothetical protein